LCNVRLLASYSLVTKGGTGMTPWRTVMSLLLVTAVLISVWATASSIYPRCCP
jgi:hypothetical protein